MPAPATVSFAGVTSTGIRPLGPAQSGAAVDATSNESAVAPVPPVNPEIARAAELPAAKRVGSNILEILVFRGLSTPIALGLVVLQGRFLAPAGRGRFVLAVLTVTIFSRLLSQLGVAVANRMSSKEWDEPHELSRLVHRAIGLGVVLGLAGGAGIVTLGALTPPVGAAAAAVAAAALLPNVIWQTLSGVLLGLGRIRAWNYVQLASPLLTVLLTVIFVVGLHGQVKAALAAWVLAHFATAAFALYLARDIWLPFRFASLVDSPSRLLLRLALAMGAVQVIALVGYRVELFVLEAIQGVSAVGVYSIANQAAESLWLIAAAIATAITAPVVHATEQEAVALVRRSVVRALLYTAAAGILVALSAPFVIRFALGSAFAGAVTPLWLLLPGAVCYAPVQVLVIYLSVRCGRPRIALAAAGISMAVTIVLSVPLIGLRGASGAAGASAAGYAVGALVCFASFRRLAGGASSSTCSRDR
jgi:O-antigen/teichoic acid export membrane protein